MGYSPWGRKESGMTETTEHATQRLWVLITAGKIFAASCRIVCSGACTLWLWQSGSVAAALRLRCRLWDLVSPIRN